MPAVLGWIGSGIVSGVMWLFKNKIGQMITAAFAFLGISIASYSLGVKPFLDQLENMASAGLGGGEFASVALQWLGLLNFDKALTMIMSAVAAKHAVTAGRAFFKKASA